MDVKINKIVGLKKEDFDKSIKSGKGLKLRRARLIPLSKPGDEMSLTSIFLSSLKLVDEFKKHLFKELRLQNGGKIYAYTEVVFPSFEDSRIDGLILVVKAGVITDAALLEMKNKNNELEKKQIEKYIQIAKALKIPKLITISNQFVSEITQSPLDLKPTKKVESYHLSWTHILTLAHILLFKKEVKIKDEDQIRIMEEIVAYFEAPTSGVVGVAQMKTGWDEITKKIHSRTHITVNDPLVKDAVLSWHQQERNMALMLSRKVGLFVISGQSKFKRDLSARLINDSKILVDTKILSSVFKVKNAVSDIYIDAFLENKSVEMAVKISMPTDKAVKGQIGWMKRQIITCSKKASGQNLSIPIETMIENDLNIDINIKHMKNDIRVPFNDLDEILGEISSKEISGFKVVLVKDFKGAFTAPKKFVTCLESMLLNFQKGFVEHLTSWSQPSPKVIENNYYSNMDYFIEHGLISDDKQHDFS